MQRIQKRIKEPNVQNSFEYTFKRKDGTTFPALAHSSPVRKDEKVTSLIAVIVDISNLKNNDERKDFLNSLI